MCAGDDRIGAAIAAAIKAEACGAASDTVETEPRRRIALWEQADSVHCSIVGTCASVGDLRRIARRVGIDVAADTPDHDVHGRFVRLSTTDNAFSRAFQKLLDARYEGALRRIARIRDAEGLADLWDDMCDRGQVAPAYWAFMSHGHVPNDLRVRVFGEVHMWSHLAGASFRRKTVEAAELRDRIRESEERARRAEAGLHEALAARDREIAELRRRLTAAQAAPVGERAADANERRVSALQRRHDKAQRALQVARARARQAEARVSELERAQGPRQIPAVASASAASATASPAATGSAQVLTGIAMTGDRPRTVLYVGGLHGHRDRLRGIAAEFNAAFLHHDGGVEDAPQRLDQLLPSVDCVFCPVSCVSHDACLRAKRACQKLNTPFVPLRSAGQSAFAKALRSLVEGDDHGQVSGHDPLQEDTQTCSSP
jgi:hypothetical protein